MEFGDISQTVIDLIDFQLLEANIDNNCLARAAQRFNRKKLLDYLRNRDDVMETAIKNNQMSLIPENIQNIFIF